MDTDLILVVGIIVCALSIPSFLGAYAEARVPRAGAIMLMIGGVLIVLAYTQRPSGYAFDEVPQVFMQVLSRLTN